MENIYALASCTKNIKKELYSPKLSIGVYIKDKKHRVSYVINETTFLINYPNKSLYEKIHPVLSHTESKYLTHNKISIDFIQEKGYNWQILFNNTKVTTPTQISRITIFLQDMMLIALYQASNYLIAIHAATLEYNKKIFIFPAISGSGKTTLSAELMKNNFFLYSDELSILDLNGNISNLPFALSIKEGSWKILENDYPILSKTDYHIRFDEQKVKFLKPTKKIFSSKKPTYLIFPKYKKNIKTKLTSLSACEALSRIKRAGYELNKPLNVETFEKILDYLLSRPTYSLDYSSLEQAIKIIKELSDE